MTVTFLIFSKNQDIGVKIFLSSNRFPNTNPLGNLGNLGQNPLANQMGNLANLNQNQLQQQLLLQQLQQQQQQQQTPQTLQQQLAKLQAMQNPHNQFR